jgi:cyanophycinase
MIGGGPVGSAIERVASDLSGGQNARWVVIPTASEFPYEAVSQSTLHAILSNPYEVLHTRDREEADSELFVAPLKTATAVWFTGGRQWRLVDAYAGTLAEREICGVLARGGLIAGTSAGATIQGSYLFRGAPEGNTILMSPGHERGFAYVCNVAIDQHVNTRLRDHDLSRLIAVRQDLLGIGIDEGTAILVQGDIVTVIGSNRVLVTDGVDHDGRPFYALRAADRLDLTTWTRLPP